jgi:hypothetical protein
MIVVCNGLHDRFQFMKTIGTLAQNIQDEINLARRPSFNGHPRSVAKISKSQNRNRFLLVDEFDRLVRGGE